MSGIYEWIRSLVFYLILMTVIINLLPDKKYDKYLRLFTGMVFLLLVFSPFTDLTGIEEQIAGTFERMTLQNDAKLLKKEIEDADGERMNRLIQAYEEAVKTDLKTMAEGTAAQCLSVDVELDTGLEEGTFGQVAAVNMQVQGAANRDIADLRKKIGEYYGLEERNITISLKNE